MNFPALFKAKPSLFSVTSSLLAYANNVTLPWPLPDKLLWRRRRTRILQDRRSTSIVRPKSEGRITLAVSHGLFLKITILFEQNVIFRRLCMRMHLDDTEAASIKFSIPYIEFVFQGTSLHQTSCRRHLQYSSCRQRPRKREDHPITPFRCNDIDRDRQALFFQGDGRIICRLAYCFVLEFLL